MLPRKWKVAGGSVWGGPFTSPPIDTGPPAAGEGCAIAGTGKQCSCGAIHVDGSYPVRYIRHGSHEIPSVVRNSVSRIENDRGNAARIEAEYRSEENTSE